LSGPSSPFRLSGVPNLPATIQPASALPLTVEYLPTARGYHQAAINLTSDDPTHPSAAIQLEGSATAPGEIDRDGDGMPDSFETRYTTPTVRTVSGLSTNLLDAHLDNDRDGLSNLEEYFLGSDPTDPASPLRLVSARYNPGAGPLIGWLSVTGKTYSVLRSTNILSGFVTLRSGIGGTGTTNTYTDSTATNRSNPYFYRLRVE
jgi:hypothetical protein